MIGPLSPDDAYRKGWASSRRSRAFDLEAAESRFLRRYGHQQHSAFVAGWTDRASDYPMWTTWKRGLDAVATHDHCSHD